MNSDTRLGINDTQILRYTEGRSVRIVNGDFQGVIGTIVEQREGGNLLIHVKSGAYVLVTHTLVEIVES